MGWGGRKRKEGEERVGEEGGGEAEEKGEEGGGEALSHSIQWELNLLNHSWIWKYDRWRVGPDSQTGASEYACPMLSCV